MVETYQGTTTEEHLAWHKDKSQEIVFAIPIK